MILRRTVALVPAFGLFVYSGFLSGKFSFSGIFGALALSIAFGAMSYYFICGTQDKNLKNSFGIVETGARGGYRIPTKQGIYIVSAIIICCLISFGFYANGV